KAGKWNDLEMIADGAASAYPEKRTFHAHCAWAKHRQGRTEEGLQLLMGVIDRFPRSGQLAYAIACLNRALNRVDEAKEWLAKAFERDDDPNKMKLRAIDQPELYFLWEEADAELGTDDDEERVDDAE